MHNIQNGLTWLYRISFNFMYLCVFGFFLFIISVKKQWNYTFAISPTKKVREFNWKRLHLSITGRFIGRCQLWDSLNISKFFFSFHHSSDKKNAAWEINSSAFFGEEHGEYCQPWMNEEKLCRGKQRKKSNWIILRMGSQFIGGYGRKVWRIDIFSTFSLSLERFPIQNFLSEGRQSRHCPSWLQYKCQFERATEWDHWTGAWDQNQACMLPSMTVLLLLLLLLLLCVFRQMQNVISRQMQKQTSFEQSSNASSHYQFYIWILMLPYV